MSDASADSAAFLTRDQLLEFAAARGCRVSSEQLDRWRKQGLVPSPRLKGRGQGRGIEARYPEAAGPQLVQVAEALRVSRDLDAARWRLWWEGYSLSDRRIVQQLARALAKVRALQADLEFMIEDDAASAEFERQTRVRLRHPELAKFRRAIGLSQFTGFSSVMLHALAGRYQGHEPSDLARVDRQIGLFGAEQRRFMNILSGAVNWTLQEIVPESIEVAELQRARQQLRRIMAVLRLLVQADQEVVEQLTGRPLPPLLVTAMKELTDEPLPPFFFCLWLGIRAAPGFAEAAAMWAPLGSLQPADWPTHLAQFQPPVTQEP